MLGDLLQAAFGGEQSANDRLGVLPGMQPLDTSSIPNPSFMPYKAPSNSQHYGLDALLPLLLQGNGRNGGGNGSLSGGSTPPGRGIFGNSEVDVLQPDDPRLVSRYGTTLARPAMRSMTDVLQSLGLNPSTIGGGYRSPQGQADIYAAKPGLAAPPGSSYHQEGLAIDLAAALQRAKVENALQQAGWNRFSPSGEPWHWSYGVTG